MNSKSQHFEIIEKVFMDELTGIDLIEYLHSDYEPYPFNREDLINLRNKVFDYIETKDRELHQGFYRLNFFIRYLNILIGIQYSEYSFQKYFIRNINSEKLNFLKETFNSGPKAYAIMTILLLKNNCVVIESRGFAKFLRSWYNFINKPIPKNNNFDATTRFIKSSISKGFYFDNSDDPVYKSLQKLFEENFMNIK